VYRSRASTSALVEQHAREKELHACIPGRILRERLGKDGRLSQPAEGEECPRQPELRASSGSAGKRLAIFRLGFVGTAGR
jgi:hypothetical protein